MRIVLLVAAASLAAAAPALGAGAFVFSGRGWGHGIGMGQYGAQGFALHGWPYGRILQHYYPDTTLAHTDDRLVRVLIVQGQSRVALSSDRPFRVSDAEGRSWTLPGRRIVLTPGPTLRRDGHRVALALPLTVDPGASPLRVGDAPYRGSLTILRSGEALSVVNSIRLELYLRGVVGWEMPHTWQPAALAAQAVAARSYALSVLHPSQSFDLFADTRDQVYGGIRAEYPSTDQAVASTSGQVLLWHGTIARTYYSSTTGGRTQSLTDAMPGLSPVPYLVSVSDPYDSLSPRHRWGPLRFSARELGWLLRTPRPRSLRLLRNASGRVAAVDVRWAGGRRRIPGRDFQHRLDLPSTWFSLGAPGPSLRPTQRPGPKPLRGWIVVLRSAPIAGPPGQLRTLARAEHARLLRSSDYTSLRPGYWVVARGPYRSHAAALAEAARLSARFSDAYARRLA